MPTAEGLLGLTLWAVASWSVLRSLVVPRGASALVGAKDRCLRFLFRLVAHGTRGYTARDAVLSFLAPMTIVTSLVMWLLMYFVAYALMLMGVSGLDAPAALREAGSSLFTLGFASSDRSSLTAIDFVAAATGPIVIGLLIGYLPAIYSSYQRRESDVTMLLARAGEPNWAPELLARHSMVGNLSGLDELWVTWERWAADVVESHTNFPALMYMRSSRAQRSWLVGLMSVMDAAAMHMSLNPQLPQGNMRVCLRQGIVCIQELARTAHIPFDPDPSPDTPSAVTAADFGKACDRLSRAGYTWTVPPEQAYLHFRGWRANYEAPTFVLAQKIDAVPAPWSGPRRPALPVMPPHRVPNRSPDSHE